MKKKLLSWIMAIIAIIPCGVFLTACDYTATDHVCDYEEYWTYDNNYHWYECYKTSCSKVTDKAEHTWDSGVLIAQATSTTPGIRAYTCTVCDYTKLTKYTPNKTMTEDEWNKAVTFENIDNYTLTTHSSDNSGYVVVCTVDGNLICRNQQDKLVHENDYFTIDYYERTIESGKVKYYNYNYNSDDAMFLPMVAYSYKEISSNEYAEAVANTKFAMFEYDDFVYNEATGKYECEGYPEYGISNIYLFFDDGRLSEISYQKEYEEDESESGGYYTLDITISYASTRVELPGTLIES